MILPMERIEHSIGLLRQPGRHGGAVQVRLPHADRTRGRARPPLSACDPVRDGSAALLPQGGRGIQRLRRGVPPLYTGEALLAMALLAMALLAMVILAMAQLAMALLTVALLTMALLTMALLTMTPLHLLWLY